MKKTITTLNLMLASTILFCIPAYSMQDDEGILSLTLAQHKKRGFTCLLIGERHTLQAESTTEKITREAFYPWLKKLLNNAFILHLESTKELQQAAYDHILDVISTEPEESFFDYSQNNLGALNHLSVIAHTDRYKERIKLSDIRINAIGCLATIFAEFEMHASVVHESFLADLQALSPDSTQILRNMAEAWAEDPLVFLNNLFFNKLFQAILTPYKLDYKKYVSQLYNLMLKNVHTTLGDLWAEFTEQIKIVNQLIKKSTLQLRGTRHPTILDPDATQLWLPIHISLIQAYNILHHHFFTQFPCTKNIADACFEVFQKFHDFRIFFDETQDDAQLKKLMVTIRNDLPNFHFIRTMLLSQKSILYAGNSHCTELKKSLKAANFSIHTIANNGAPLNKAHIDQFFNKYKEKLSL